MSPRNVCVITGTRAEYGLLRHLMKEIRNSPRLKLQVAVTGMHLSSEFGSTYQEIEKDGFAIDERIDMRLGDDSPVGIARSMGLAIQGFGEAFHRLAPDVVVVLGDRYEILAAAQAALVARIPLAHIHGGERTEGAFDESIRHSLTKMSQLHFVAAEEYRRRVIQLGEDPARVFCFGAIGLDFLHEEKLLNRQELERSLGSSLGHPTFLVTYHPETLSSTDPAKPMGALLVALDRFPQARVVFTKPNSDPRSRAIADAIDRYVQASSGRAVAFTSLGQLRYLSLLKEAEVVIGNSSSGLIEAPAVGTATINIGDRQKGRLLASSVLSSRENADAIAGAIAQALSPEFQTSLTRISSPYGRGQVSKRIRETLEAVELGVRKTFHDLDPGAAR